MWSMPPLFCAPSIDQRERSPSLKAISRQTYCFVSSMARKPPLSE